MRISDWSSDVCSSDLKGLVASGQRLGGSCGVACEVPWRKVVTPHGPRVEHRRSTGRTAMATRLGAPRSAAAPDQSDMAEAATRADLAKIGRAHVCTPVTNAHLVCRLLLEKKKKPKTK